MQTLTSEEQVIVLDELEKYCLRNNESIPEETLKQWVDDFKNSGLPLEKIQVIIRKTTFNETYGRTKFSDFAKIMQQEGVLYTFADMIAKAREIAWVIYDNTVKKKQIEQNSLTEYNKEIKEVENDLRMFRENADYKRETIKQEKEKFINEILDNIQKYVHVGQVIFFLNRMKNALNKIKQK